MLNDTERLLIQRAFSQGPAAFLDAGFTDAESAKFCARPDVRSFMALLERELDHKDALEVRSRYLARRALSSLSPGALAIIGQALSGPQYLTHKTADNVTAISVDANGKPILLRAEVTPTQLRAAELVMDGIGVPYTRAKNDQVAGIGADVTPLFKVGDAPATVVTDDPDHTLPSQRALSRERVRAVITVLSSRVPDMHRRLNENLGLVSATASTESTPPKKRRKPRAKASKGKSK